MLKNKILSAAGGEEKLYVDSLFSTYLYTGNGSTQTINNGIDLAGKGGLVWTKTRDVSNDHSLHDTTRGMSNRLQSNTSGAQSDLGIYGLTPLLNGFQDAFGWVSGRSLVSWTFRRAERFFDVVTYTGDGSGNRDVPHALGAVPGFIVIKRTDSTGNWGGWHRGNGSTMYSYLSINSTAAGAEWGNAHTSATFKVTDIYGQGPTTYNVNGATYVAYLWAHDPSEDGIVQCGSFTTDASGNATVNLGWEPQYVMIKSASSTGYWNILDNMRGMTVGGNEPRLFANTSWSEDEGGAPYNWFEPTATGFSQPTNNNPYAGSAQTYIYLAIRRSNKPPTTGTEVYNAIARTGTGAAATVTGVGFAPDLVSIKRRAIIYETSWEDRLRGANKVLATASTGTEVSTTQYVTGFDTMDGVNLGTDVGVNNLSNTYINHFFRRAPGFFSSFAYTGTGANRTTSHDLSVTPDLLIVKSRSATGDWQVWYNGLTSNEKLVLNSNAAKVADVTAWNSTLPTATNITVGTSANTNANGTTCIAYAFGNLPGIQKIGTYVGDGTSGRVIDCGFTTGARFVCIKAVSTTGSWLVSDSARGITSSNDPYLQLNSTAAEVTTEDWLDPSSSGFIVNNVSSSNANASGVTYMYWAIS